MRLSESDMPGRIAVLPRNKAGYPVPDFVAWIDGEPDFRVIKPGGIQRALRLKLCWVCGTPFQRQEDRAFVIGPMCAVNRVSAEPPSHQECGVYSGKYCPFLSTPQMVRRDRGKPAEAVNPAGIMITRNPGVALVWVTGYKSWKARPETSQRMGGVLMDIGDPKEALWFARGRQATRAEVLESIDTGLPILHELAEQDGPDSLRALADMHARALEVVPA